MVEFIQRSYNYISNLPQNLEELFSRAGLIPYVLLWFNMFLETGGMVFNFLPGNSVVLAASAFAANSDLVRIEVLVLVFLTSTFLGDTASFFLGRFFGRKYSSQDRIKFINKDHVAAAHEYFEENGRMTFVVSRFIPIFRGVMPFAAGFAQISYRRILPYALTGIVLWNAVYISAGYFFGNIPQIQENFSLMLLIIAGVTTVPTLFVVYRNFKKFRKTILQKTAEKATQTSEDDPSTPGKEP